MANDDEGERRTFSRRNGERQLFEELRDHKSNPYAHGELVGRLQQEGLNIRERFENRLARLEQRMAQVLLVGAVALILLGATAGAIATRLLH